MVVCGWAGCCWFGLVVSGLSFVLVVAGCSCWLLWLVGRWFLLVALVVVDDKFIGSMSQFSV